MFEAENSPSFHSLLGGLGTNDLNAKQAQNTGPAGTVNTSNPAQGQTYIGYAQSPGSSTVTTVPNTGDVQDVNELQLNFEDTDVAAVCKAILSDILKVNYALDPRVTGPVSLASTRPLPRKALISLFETALKQVNAVLIVDHEFYKIVPSNDGNLGTIDTSASGDGFGVTAITVKNISPETVAHVLESFASRPGAVKPDATLGMIFVQGTSGERRSLVQTAAMIDSDFLKSQTVGVFPLANSTPDQVIGELTKIIDSGEGGVTHSLVRLQTMSRMNGILVIAKRKPIYDMVATWIQRLDKQNPALNSIKIYRLRYASAKTVAALVGDLLNGNGKNASSPTAGKDQDLLQPGGTPTSLQNLPTVANANNSQPSSPSSDASAATRSSATTLPGGPTPIALSTTNDSTSTSTDQGSAISVGNGKIKIIADVDNNALLILASAQDYRIVEAAIRQLDRPTVQVAIEATIAEVTLSDELQYGVQAYLRGTRIGGGITSSISAATIAPTLPGGNLIFGSQNSPSIVLNALRSRTSVKVLSSPSLVVLDNQSAVLQVGDQVAVKTSSVASTLTSNTAIVNSIDYKDTGIILHVRPQVRANGTINLDVTQETSNIVTNSGGTDGLTPTISQRKVQSSVSVTSGQTVLLAGMISETQSKQNNGLPSVGQFQFFTDLLSQKDNTTSRNELIIFIKPQILRDGADAEAVAEEFRSRLTSLRDDPTSKSLVKSP